MYNKLNRKPLEIKYAPRRDDFYITFKGSRIYMSDVVSARSEWGTLPEDADHIHGTWLKDYYNPLYISIDATGEYADLYNYQFSTPADIMRRYDK